MLFNVASAEVDQKKLEIIEKFLSSMNTLEAEMTMDIICGKDNQEQYAGKIWLDRKNKLLRINYGKSSMVAKNDSLIIKPENEKAQEFAAQDTPAGLLLRPSISFQKDGVVVKSLTEMNGLWMLSITYDSPAGSIPVTMYFKPKPVMLLMGWTIQNPNGSITNVHLNPDATHMAIAIPASIFKLD
jgi:outer membrane lipoprotein-sorting protein